MTPLPESFATPEDNPQSHAKVELGQEIPEELFAAVAAVLSQVYRMQSEVARV